MTQTVLRHDDVAIVRRVDANLAEIVRALGAHVVVVGAGLGPGLSRVRRSIHFAADGTSLRTATASARWGSERRRARILILDDRIEHARCPKTNVQPDSPNASRGQA